MTMTKTMTKTMAVTKETTSFLSASRSLSFSGRRHQRAAGERVAGLFEEHGRMVYGVCRLILRDPVEAEDAAQQTFLSAYRGLLAGQEPREPAAWLGTIARNECRTRLRAQRTEPVALVTAISGDDTQRDVGRRAEIDALCSALAVLPQQQRDAIVLREFYGLSYAEVAGALGLSGAAVESLIFRSRKRLQAQLRPMRSALGVLTLPLALRDSLAQVLPGFGGAGASAGGVAVLAKVGSAPLAAKIAAATLAIGTAGTVAGVETHTSQHRTRAPRQHAAALVRELAPVSVAKAAPSRVVQVSLAVAPKTQQPTPKHELSDQGSTGDRSGRSGGEQNQVEPRDESDRSGPSSQEPQDETGPVETTTPVDSHDGGGDSGRDGSGDGSGRGPSDDDPDESPDLPSHDS